VQHDSPHQVFNVTWRVTNLMTGQTANATSLLGTMTDAFPKLYFDLCDLIGDDWDETGLGCRTPGGRKRARTFDFYVCPGHTVPTGCGGPREGYCGKWGCETTGQAYWKPSSLWDLISLKRGNTPQNQGPCYDSSAVSSDIKGATPGGRCNPLVLEFTDAGKKASWDGPKVWGLRLYRSTGTDPVTRFSLTRRVLNIGPRVPIGPNPVIIDQLPPSRPVQIMLPRPPQPPPPGAASIVPETAPPSNQPGTGDRLLNLVDGAYQALNLTSPDKTQECWLCLVAEPPYYEGVAVLGTYSNHTSAPANCSVASQHKLTLSEVTGRGLCIGTVPKTHQALCNTTLKTNKGSYYLVAPAGTTWACNTGLTPCLSATVLNRTTDYCVLVELWPRVTYHPPSYVYSQFEKSYRHKR
nr:glycoprotein 70 [Friend mink cell focus-forming virus]